MICAVILAAGLSQRMGEQKLLLPFGGKTVLTHIVDQVITSAIDETYVVTGHESKRVNDELSGRPVTIVSNPDYKKGMLSSVRCGLAALPSQCRATLVALGDQPSVTSKLINEMIGSYDKTEKKILVPAYNGRRGHPLLFSYDFSNQIMNNFDTVGLRGLLHSHPDDVFELSVPTSSILSDIDYPQDYQRELSLIEKNNVGGKK
jgi:molybdenum cofactor cytidylyltransferase